MKTNKELNALKEEVETLNNKLRALTDEELEQVTGGSLVPSRRAISEIACEYVRSAILDRANYYKQNHGNPDDFRREAEALFATWESVLLAEHRAKLKNMIEAGYTMLSKQ